MTAPLLHRALLSPGSVRAKFLIIMLVGAIVPMGLVGFWLAGAARASGTELLRERLDSTLITVALEVGNRWVADRSALISLSESHTLQRLMDAGPSPSVPVPLPEYARSYAATREGMRLVLVRSVRGAARFVLASDATGRPQLVAAAESLRVADPVADAVAVRLPIIAPSGSPLGSVEGRLTASGLLPPGVASAAGTGAVLSMVDRASGTAVIPLPFDAALLTRGDFQWEGRHWLSARRSLEEPPVDLFAAAPLDAYIGPFERAATRGLVALVLVALAVLGVGSVLTQRVTRSLEALAVAADAVSSGDLDRHLDARGSDEVSRVARAFNTMIESLRSTLRELSQRQAVAAVGEFAAALAHEVRNPLSAMKLNLQHVEEQTKSDPVLRASVGHALRDIERLDRTVAAALRIARTGRAAHERVDVWCAIDAAARAALPEFHSQGASLEVPPESARSPLYVKGDSAALEQVVLNLLLNAAQASAAGETAGIELGESADQVRITVWDHGRGIAAEDLARAFEPFYSTRAEGTGLGLSVAKRIVGAHRGAIGIETGVARGTRVWVTLPRVA